MDCTKIVKEYILHIGKNVVFTDDLPLKWSCIGIPVEEGKCDLKFSLLSVDREVDKNNVVTNVSITGRYVEPPVKTGFGTIRKDRWSPVFDSNKVLGCTELKKEITFNVNTKHSPPSDPTVVLYYFNLLKIEFIVTIPKTRSLPFSGYDFTEKNVDHDQILVVEAQKFYVKKAVLSHYSPFFNTLFNNENFEESKKDEIELKDLNAKEFEVLLQIIHPTTVAVNVENVEFLWKLTDRFNIASVAQMCESFICNLEGKLISLEDRFKMAQLYNSDKLMASLIELLKKI